MVRLQAVVALAVISSVCTAGAAVGEKRFEVTLLPSLSTPFGTFDRVEALAINNRGLVVGRACGALTPTDTGCAAFRTRRGELEDLDPDGRYNSQALAINKRGVLLGVVGSAGDKRFFKTARSGRVEFLDRGLPRKDSGRLRYGTFVRAFNDRGVVVVDLDKESGSEPYVYRESVGGWEPLTAGEPEFEDGVRFEGLNNRGDAVLVKAVDGESAAYLYRRNRSIVVIRPMAPGILSLDAPTRSGAVSGRVFAEDSDKAVYFDRAGGLREIHPEGYRHSYALQTLEDGTALVAATRGQLFGPTVFYFTYRPGEGLRQLWTKEELQSLRERAGCKKPNRSDFFPPRMNRKRELLGTLICSRGRGAVHFSAETGFTLLEEVLAERGFGNAPAEGQDINDRGQLLLRGFIDGNTRGVVLRPVQ